MTNKGVETVKVITDGQQRCVYERIEEIWLSAATAKSKLSPSITEGLSLAWHLGQLKYNCRYATLLI